MNVTTSNPIETSPNPKNVNPLKKTLEISIIGNINTTHGKQNIVFLFIFKLSHKYKTNERYSNNGTTAYQILSLKLGVPIVLQNIVSRKKHAAMMERVPQTTDRMSVVFTYSFTSFFIRQYMTIAVRGKR